jgi:glycosyltransferase involved in cell wall biosynthesis
LGIAGSVKFLGPRNDVPELLGQLDLFAFCTTRAEGFGIAVIEAMSAGVPVVASDVAACREVLSDGRDGVLVEANEGAWVAALTRLMNDEVLRASLGAQGVEVARERFSSARCGDRYFSLLGIPNSTANRTQSKPNGIRERATH